MDYRSFHPDELAAFSRNAFRHFDVPDSDALVAASVLSLADCRGIESHGVARLHTYCGLLAEGSINPTPNICVSRESDATATVDGDNGLGLVVGPHANQLAIEKADQVGSGWIAVRNSNHFGIAGYYVLESLRRDQIGLAMSNSTAAVAPLWGSTRRLGTNPIAMAFPGDLEPPVVIDMATSTVALGKIENAFRKGQEISSLWAIDASGNPTSKPSDVLEGGSILALGFDRVSGGHKGYCLSAMVDVFTGVLSGAAWGPYTPPFEHGRQPSERNVGDGIGHFFGAMRIDGFAEVNEFKKEVDLWINAFKAARPTDDREKVLVPGRPETEATRRSRNKGIRVHSEVHRQLLELADQTGVPPPEPMDKQA